MNCHKVNPLNPLLGKIERFEQTDNAIKQFESKRVEWTLRRLGMERQRKEIYRDSVTSEYTCDAFNRVVDNFPMVLCCESLKGKIPIHKDQKSVHPNWFKKFLGLSFAEAYADHFEKLSAAKLGKPIGMIFPRKGFAQGLLMHNGDWDYFVPPNSSCHLFKGGKKVEMNLVVQPYSSFVDHIKDLL